MYEKKHALPNKKIHTPKEMCIRDRDMRVTFKALISIFIF